MASRLLAVSLKTRGLVVYERRPGHLRAFLNQSVSDGKDISVAIATDVSDESSLQASGRQQQLAGMQAPRTLQLAGSGG